MFENEIHFSVIILTIIAILAGIAVGIQFVKKGKK